MRRGSLWTREGIKALRLRLGLTQMELARVVCCSFATVNRWENGHALPLPLMERRLLELAKARD